MEITTNPSATTRVLGVPAYQHVVQPLMAAGVRAPFGVPAADAELRPRGNPV